MKQDETIEIARLAGFVVTHIGDPIGTNYAMIETFAKLVAAKQREACAKTVEQCVWPRSAEHPYDTRVVFAEAIRARGEA